MVESDKDYMTYCLSKGNLVPNPKDLEHPHSFNQFIV